MKSILKWAMIPILASLFLGSVLNKLYLNEVSWQVLSGLLLSLYLVAILIIKNKTLRTKKLIHVITWIGLLGTCGSTGYLWKGVIGSILGITILVGFLILHGITLRKAKQHLETKTPEVRYTQNSNSNQTGGRTDRFSIRAQIPNPDKPNEEGTIDTRDLFDHSTARLRVDAQIAEAQRIKSITEAIERLLTIKQQEKLPEDHVDRMIAHLEQRLLEKDNLQEDDEELNDVESETTEEIMEETTTSRQEYPTLKSFRQRQKQKR